MSARERFQIVTKGPGSGKMTLIEALVQRGYARTMEAGRGVIQDQVLIGGHALPWDDRALSSFARPDSRGRLSPQVSSLALLI